MALVHAELDACSIHKWQPPLRRVTIKTLLIPLLPSVVAYLTADEALFLPDDSESDDSGFGDADIAAHSSGGRVECEAGSPDEAAAEDAGLHVGSALHADPQLRTLCLDVDAAIQKCARVPKPSLNVQLSCSLPLAWDRE